MSGATLVERLLDQKLDQLERSRQWSPRVIAKLERLIRTGDDSALYRVNPLKFGKHNDIPEQEAIDLFLYAAKGGLFFMNWHLLCPGCGDVVESLNRMNHLHPHYHCSLCQADLTTSLDDFISITFTISPDVREIIYHHPEKLSAEDYMYRSFFSSDAYVGDGIAFPDAFKGMVNLVSYLEPGETREFDLDLKPGLLRGADIFNQSELNISVSAAPADGIQKVALSTNPGRFEGGNGELSAGRVSLTISNQAGKRGLIVLALFPAGFEPPELKYAPYLSGKRLLTSQSFRDLFRSEVIHENESIGVKNITFLFSDLKGSTALYDRIGDFNAYSLVGQHFDSLEKVIRKNNGAILKTMGDAVMATFFEPISAVRAATEILDEIAQFNTSTHDKELLLKIGIHAGPCIIVNSNDHIDYFGQTVNIASRVQNLADAQEICLTGDVFVQSGVGDFLKDFQLESRKARLKGIGDEVEVYSLKSRQPDLSPVR